MLVARALFALGLLGPLAASTPVAPLLERGGQSYPQCRRNACLNVVLENNKSPAYKAYHDCAAYQQTTMTPCAVTVTAAGYKPTITKTCATVRGTTTVTETCTSTAEADTIITGTSYSTTYTAVSTATVYEEALSTTVVKKRSAAKSPTIPSYAKNACKTAGSYTSACKCIGAPTQTHYAPTPTTTVTKTATVCATATSGRVVTTKTTSVVTTTKTGYTTITLPTTVPTTTTVTVTTTAPTTGATQTSIFDLYDRANALGGMISAPTSSANINGFIRVQYGTTPATRFYLSSDGTLRSVANDNKAVGTFSLDFAPYVTVQTDIRGFRPLMCSLDESVPLLNQTGALNCSSGPDDPRTFYQCGGVLVAWPSDRFFNATDNGCDNSTPITLNYQVLELGSPVDAPSTPSDPDPFRPRARTEEQRTEERGQARNRRKRRPLPDIIPKVVDRATESE